MHHSYRFQVFLSYLRPDLLVGECIKKQTLTGWLTILDYFVGVAQNHCITFYRKIPYCWHSYTMLLLRMYNPTHGLVPEQLLVVGVGQRGGPGGRRSQILCARRGGGRLRPDVDGNVLLLAVLLLLRLLGRAARHLRRGARTVSSGLLVRRGLEVHEKACKCCKLALLHQFRVHKNPLSDRASSKVHWVVMHYG